MTSHAAPPTSSQPPGRHVLMRTALRPQSRTAPERPAVSSGQNDCGPSRLTPRATNGSPSGPTMVLPSTANAPVSAGPAVVVDVTAGSDPAPPASLTHAVTPAAVA